MATPVAVVDAHSIILQVAIYSESDRLQPHRLKADESYPVGAKVGDPIKAYLDIEVGGDGVVCRMCRIARSRGMRGSVPTDLKPLRPTVWEVSALLIEHLHDKQSAAVL